MSGINIITESLRKSIDVWEEEKFHANAEYDFERADALEKKIEEAKSIVNAADQDKRTI